MRGKSLCQRLDIENIDWKNFWVDISNLQYNPSFRKKLGQLPLNFHNVFKSRFDFKGNVKRSYEDAAKQLGLNEADSGQKIKKLIDWCIGWLKLPQYNFRWNLDLPYSERKKMIEKLYGPYANFYPSTKTMSKTFWKSRHRK